MRKPSIRFDAVAIRECLFIRLDQECKAIIPGRPPWPDYRAARRYLSQVYNEQIEDLAMEYGVSITRIRKVAPGMLPILGAVSQKFREANQRNARRSTFKLGGA